MSNCALHEMEPEAIVNALQNVERKELFRVIKDVSKRLDPNSYTNMLCALSGVIDPDVYEKIVQSQVNYWRGLSQSLEKDLKLLEAHEGKLYDTYSIPIFPDGYERRNDTVPMLNASSSRQTGTVVLSTPQDLERSDDVRKSVIKSPIFIDLGESSNEIEGSKTVNENVGSASVKMGMNLSGTVKDNAASASVKRCINGSGTDNENVASASVKRPTLKSKRKWLLSIGPSSESSGNESSSNSDEDTKHNKCDTSRASEKVVEKYPAKEQAAVEEKMLIRASGLSCKRREPLEGPVPLANTSSLPQAGPVILSMPQDVEHCDEVKTFVKESRVLVEAAKPLNDKRRIKSYGAVNENVASASVKKSLLKRKWLRSIGSSSESSGNELSSNDDEDTHCDKYDTCRASKKALEKYPAKSQDAGEEKVLIKTGGLPCKEKFDKQSPRIAKLTLASGRASKEAGPKHNRECGPRQEKGLREDLAENANVQTVISGLPSASGRASREHEPESNRESAKKSKKRRYRQRKRRRNHVNNNLGVSQENVTTSHGREPTLPHPLVICALPAQSHCVESRTGNNISWMATPRR